VTVAPRNELDIAELLQQARDMQKRLATTQRELLATDCQGTAGGSLVKATVSGRGELLGLEISPVIADPDRTREIEDMVVSAVQDAHRNLREQHRRALTPVVDAFEVRDGGGGHY
jgi:nucleoid-associated protein EbfC